MVILNWCCWWFDIDCDRNNGNFDCDNSFCCSSGRGDENKIGNNVNNDNNSMKKGKKLLMMI